MYTWISSSLTSKHYTILERHARDKYSTLLQKFVTYGRKKLTLATGVIFTSKVNANFIKVMLNVVMLNAFMLNAVMLSVKAPRSHLHFFSRVWPFPGKGYGRFFEIVSPLLFTIFGQIC